MSLVFNILLRVLLKFINILGLGNNYILMYAKYFMNKLWLFKNPKNKHLYRWGSDSLPGRLFQYRHLNIYPVF